MSRTIDERIVEMRFDNRQFEQNVQTSLSTLDKLKRGLDLDNAAKSLDGLGDAAKRCDMSVLGKSVGTVQAKFSAFQVVAMTTLSNITNSAVNTGKRLVSALIIDPIKTGFQEYETQIGAVQTILANTQHEGTNLQQVNRALDELNTYADKTIYNFTEMTRNIGTFTAAGVNLRTSVDSIKGIANLAAISGSTSQQASTAMYQLSQALAAGKVSLMDWNSVVNAGMGGKVFQDALVRTSELLGTGAQNAINMYGSFRESLTRGEWLTTEVLTETLKQFAGAYSEADLIQQGFSEAQARDIAQMAKTAEDAATKVKTFTQLWDTLKESAQSGWTTTWEILVGDFEEAKEVLTEVSDAIGGVISETSQARNELLSGGLSSGWKQLLDQGIADEGGFIESIQEVARESGDAFDKLVADSESFSDALKQGLTDGVVSSETLTQAVHNLREKMTGMSQEERKAAGYTAEMIEQIEALDKGLQNGSVSMEEFTEKILRPSGRENLIQAVWNAAKGLVSVITPIKDAFREIFPPATADQLYSLTETLRSFSERLTLSEETADKLGRTFKGLFSVLDLVRQGALAIFNALAPLGSGAGSLADGILTITAGIGDFLVGINEAAKQGEFFGMVAQTVASALEFVVSGIERLTGFLADAFAAPGLESFQALLGRIQTRIGQVVDAVSGLGGGVSDAADTMDSALENSKFLQMLQTIFNGAKTLVSGIIGVFGGLAGALVENLSNANFSGVIDLLNGVSLGAIALGIKKFLDSFREVTDSVGSIKEGVIGILDGVKGCFQAWQNDVNAKALLKIAAAVAVLSASILTISLIDSEKLTASLGAITVLFTELMAAMAVFGKLDLNVRGTMKRSTAMIALSSSVLILASALKSIATLEPEQMAAGLAGIAGLMAALVAAAKVLGSGSSSIIKGSAQMVVFAAAIKILASACADLAQLDLAGLAKGLIGVGVLLAEVSLFMNAAKFSGRSVVTASGVLVLAGAMKVLASACKDFAQMGVGELVKGLSAIGAVLLEITAFTKLAGSAKGLITTGAAMIEIGAAMKIFASAMADFGRMSLAEIGKGLLAMGGALAEVAVAMRFMPRNMVTMGAGLIAVGAALNIIADAMRSMGGMSWEAVAKSLVTMGGALAELAVGLNFMNGTLGGSAAMLVAAAALAVLTPVLVTLGSMSWEAIAKGLVTVAGAFAVIGTAGALLTPLLPTILGLGGAFALIGVGVAGVGAGLLLVGTGLSAIAVGITALATSLGAGVAIIVAGLTSIITGIAALIPAIVEKLGEAVVAFAQVITNGAPAIGEAVKTLVLTMVDVLVECVPAIAEGALELVAGVLDALVAYTPQIVDSIMQFLIAVIDGLARNMPTLIQSVVDLLMSFFSGIVSALGSIDTDALLKGIAGIGLLSGIMVALGALAGLIPSAMVGVLGLGVVIAELAIVLAAVGALAQIPGLEWLISEGGQLLQTIGNAIGGFIGGIVGGFMSGVSGSFPQIGMDLAAFMTNIQPFIDGARGIDPAMLEGVKALTGAIMLITAADLLEGLTSWLTGGSSLSTFAEELVPFGEAMKKFSHSITGLDGDLVSTAAIAGKTLAEMAATLPNSGGIAGFFAGENDMGSFGDQLVGFGGSMMKFAASIKGLDTDAVQNAAIAGKAMAELAATLPNTGGAVGFFAGNNDMDDFGEQLVPFGAAIKAYSDAVKGLDVEAVTNSAIAGQAMSELAATLPNTGGAVAFFAGDNDLATFGEQLVSFGASIKSYAQEVTGLDTDAVASSTVAGQTLVELANTLPNTGGLVAFFTGDNDLETFGEQLVPFGEAMKAYSDSVTGMDSAAVTASATAAKALAELQASLPNIGGVVDFFTGGNDLETFANGLLPFGEGMKAYADAVSGMDAGAVSASIIAAQALAELQASLPHVGGVMSFFTGGNDLGLFAEGILSFGEAMNSYGNAVSGIDAGAVSASATAAQALSRLQASLPNVGGIMEFFTGGNDLGKFSEGIIPFGEAMKSYGDAVADIRPEAVESSASAGMALVELAKALPNTGGLLSFFTGGTDLASFGDDLTLFGADLSAYAEAISNVKADVVTASANAAEALSNLASGLPDSSLFDKWFGGDQTLASFGGDISKFGAAMKDYYGQISGIDTGRMADVVAQVWSLLELAEGAAGVNTSGLTGFADSMRKMGDAGISGFTSAFYNCGDTVNKAVSSMLSTVSGAVLSNLPVTNGAMETVVQSLANIVDGKVPAIRTSTSDMMRTMEASITAHSRTVGDAMRTVLSTAVSNINRMKPEFETAGKNAGQGFINGINSKLGGARSAGRSLGLAALEAAKKALDSHSPSREFIHLGENVGEGLAIGVNNSIVPAAQAASGMIDEVIAVSEKGVDAFEDWINEKQYYGELSLMDELAGWENLQKKYRAGSEERMKIDREVYRVQNELVSATYQASLDWIEEEKYYKRLSTEEELAAYERMQARYLEGSKERMELDRKVFTLRNQLVDESYQNSMDWIEEEKYYNRLSLADELAAYKRVQSRYAKGTEERKKLDREVYRLEQEIYEAQQQYIADVQSVQESANQRRIQLEEAYANKVKSINEQLERDIESLNQQYQDAVESRTKSLYQSYGLFDEVAKKEAVSSETLMQNLEGQVQEFGEWQDILGQLSARGVDSDLIAELQEMGPSAIEEIRALNSMSDDELEKYVSLWSIKHAQARDQATSELEGLRVETQEQIAQLRADAAVELEEYRLTWQSEMAQLEEDTSRQLASLRQEFSENVGLIKRDTEAKMAEMTEAARKILSEAGWTETGQQIPAGLAQGVAQSKSTFIDELTSMALAGVEAVKNTLEINSPSRVFRELGSFTGLGFVSGLAGYAERSFAAGADMADSAVDGLSGAIAGLPDLLSGEAEMRPTIRPVLDLSDLTGASTQIDSLFYPLRSIRLAGQASLAFQNASGENRMTVKVDNDDIIEELRTLRSEMAEMTERMERMRVVLDTGTLVGEMAGPMDNALGQRATRRGRGN